MSSGGTGGDDEESDVEVMVISDEEFSEFEEGSNVSHTRAREEGDIRFLDFFFCYCHGDQQVVFAEMISGWWHCT